MLPDCAKEPQFEKAYRLLNLSDHEFNAIRNGSLESLGEDRTRLILDKALSWAAQNYAGWDLYLCLQGFVSVLAVMFFLTNMRPYESDLDTITPEIQTPRAVGQYQHGSARWMTDSEKDKAFDSYILDPHNPTIRQLLDTGYDGLDFLKEK